MNPALAIMLAAAASYLFGSLPFGFLTARFVAGIDIRAAGSGNIGATNVARVLGAKWGILVLLLDALKGMLPVALIPPLLVGSEAAYLGHLEVVCGAATIVGHIYPCWLGFRGGKGVATALGVVLVLAPLASLGAVVAFAIVFVLTRIVSLSSVVAAVSFAAVEIGFLLPNPFSSQTWSRAIFSLLVPMLIVVRHRSNMLRLIRGEEPRFRFRAGTPHEIPLPTDGEE